MLLEASLFQGCFNEYTKCIHTGSIQYSHNLQSISNSKPLNSKEKINLALHTTINSYFIKRSLPLFITILRLNDPLSIKEIVG